MRFFSVAFLVMALTGSTALLTACGGSDKAVSFDSGGVKQTFTQGEAVHDFPLPIYPKAKTTGSVESKGDGDENSKFLMLTSDDGTEPISRFYQDSLKKDGWTVSQNSVLPSLVKIDAKKNDLEASVMISAGEGEKTSISLSLNKESKDATKMPVGNFIPDKMNPPTD